MPFGRLVCGAKRKASDNDKKSEVKKVKMAELGDSKATNGTCEMRDVENVEDWGREADMEMQKKKLTVNLPNTRSRLPRLRRQLREDTPLEVKPAFKRKERLTQQKGKAETRKDVKTDAMKAGKANITKDIKMEATKVVKVESTKDGKAETAKDRRARDPKAERNVRRGGKRVETTEDDEPKEERIKEDAVKGGGGTMAEEEREENPRKREKGKEKATKAKATHRLKTALGVREKPLKVKDRAVAKTEDVPLAVVPVPLPAAASMKEPDIVSAEPNCQELPCQVQQVTVPVVPHATRQLQIMQREQTMDLDDDDNGCLSLHMLSHSMQRGSKEDQLYCLQYANDIMAYLKSLEAKYVIPADFSAPVHPQTKSCMRATLVDWLVQVQEHQGLLEESLHLCIAMLDVYLSRCRVTFSQYQLVGVTCLFIASKYEERFPPTIKSLINLTDNSYIYDEVIAMERHVLKGLDYQLSIPTPLVFLHWFLWRLDCKEADRELLEMMCIYILSLTLLRSTFPKFSASLKSAAVILISRELLASHGAAFPADASKQLKVRAGVSANPWDVKCVQVTGYELRDLKACSALMVKELKMAKTMKFQGPQEKFNQPQYLSVSSHPALAAVALNELTEMLDRLPEG